MKKNQFTPSQIDRIIQMGWEDRTPFDEISAQFNLTHGEIIKLMRSEMKSSSFKMWRKRMSGRKTKHTITRNPEITRFCCPTQKN
jgi:uncharacterized protein (TIGR03643 family)